MRPQRPRHQRNASAPKSSPKVSEHFEKSDFCCHCGECDNAIRISLSLVGGLEMVACQLDTQIHVIKAYMCLTSAEKAGDFKRNYHSLGLAAIFEVDGLSLGAVLSACEAVPEFKSIGLDLEHGQIYVDTRKEPDRLIWVRERTGGPQAPLTPDLRARL